MSKASTPSANTLKLTLDLDAPNLLERLLWNGEQLKALTDDLIRRKGRNHKHVVIAALPKSGSTLLWRLLEKITGYHRFHLCVDTGSNEQVIDRSVIPAFLSVDTLTRQHLRASEENLELLSLLDARVIVLARDMCDMVISLYDFINNGHIRSPALIVTSDFYEMDERMKLDYLIELSIPWYLHMYVSWLEAEKAGFPMKLVSYEALMSDPNRAVTECLEFSGISVGQAAVEKALAAAQSDSFRTGTRYNKGVIGRGRELLSSEQQAKIKSFGRFFPGYDLSLIGL